MALMHFEVAKHGPGDSELAGVDGVRTRHLSVAAVWLVAWVCEGWERTLQSPGMEKASHDPRRKSCN